MSLQKPSSHAGHKINSETMELSDFQHEKTTKQDSANPTYSDISTESPWGAPLAVSHGSDLYY